MEREIVDCIILCSTGLILLWDVVLYSDKIPGNTISQVMIQKTKERPWIPLLWGILMGHWFF